MATCRWACILLAASLPTSSSADGSMQFEHLGPADGLPHNTVNDILQDRSGFLWVATDGGLSRYDGYGFTSYRLEPGLGRSHVMMGLLQSADGTLWVASETGLWRFDVAAGEFSAPDFGGEPPPVGFSQAMLEDRRGAIWAATGPTVWRKRGPGEPFRRMSVAGSGFEVVWRLAEDPDGRVWALVGDGLGMHPELRLIWHHGTVTSPLGAPVAHRFHLHLSFDSAGSLWTGPLADDATRPYPKLAPDSGLDPASYFNDIAELDDGRFWLGTATGLYAFDPVAGDAVRHWLRSEGASWQSEHVRSLLVDRSGSLWVGTLGGLFRHDPQAKAFRSWRHDPRDPQSLSAGPVSDIVAGPEGGLWIGTFGGGVNRVDPASGRAERFGNPLLGNRIVWSLAWRGDELWVGSGSLPKVFDRRSASWRLASVDSLGDGVPTPSGDEPPERRITPRSQVVDAAGRLWLGTFHSGLFVRETDGSWRRFPELLASHLAIGGSRTDGRDDALTLWLGHLGAVTRFRPETGKITRYPLVSHDGPGLDNVEVFDIVPERDADGGESLWLATSAGLGRLESGDDSARLPIAAEELPGTVVFSIQPDDRGRLWLGTNQGLVRFLPDAPPGRRVRAYDRSDGLANVEFNRHSRYRAPDGTLYLGGMKGVTVFHPDAIRDNPLPPPVVLTKARVVGREGETRHGGEGLSLLQLPPGTAEVTFHFTALNFTSAERNRYRYRLEGFDADWVDGGVDRFARYTNVPPGRYEFRVQAANNDGVWNEEGLRLPVVVRAPYWQTWWFRVAVLAALAGLLAFAYRARVARLIELQRVRLRIAGDLHDELGSDLSGIALATARLADRDYLEEVDRRRLSDVQSASLQVMQGLRDIVWYVNPDHDRLGSLAPRMRSAAKLLLAGIEHRFVVDATPAAERGLDAALDMEVRRDVYLVYKELLTNVARHAGAETVEIRLAAATGELLVEVVDDGCGFDPGATTDGSGLASARRRAEQIGARLEITRGDSGGTTARLRLPL